MDTFPDTFSALKTTGIRNFKARLSGYLRDVQKGGTVLVTDRGRVVAEVRPPPKAKRKAGTEAQRYAAEVAAGRIRPARGKKPLRWPPLTGKGAPAGTAKALIDWDRGE